MAKLFIEDLADLKSKRVLVRVDFNVPLKDGVVEDPKRIVASLPTIQYLAAKGARVILMSHLGRPDGKVEESMRLAPVAAELSKQLAKPVATASDCVGPAAQAAVAKMQDGDVLLLENLRFHAAEEANDPVFSKELASLGDVYVNDAFGTAHRAHASTAGVTGYLKQSVAGYLMKKELDFLGGAIESPKRPFVAIIGGAKVSGKIDVIRQMLPKVDKLIIGGGMAYTFARAKGLETGRSLVEVDKVELAKQILKESGDKLMLPSDCLITDHLDFKARTLGATKTCAIEAIPSDWEAVDIGPVTTEKYASVIRGAKTVLWNGPMGVFEIEGSSKGTFGVAAALAEATALGAITVVGGGDSASAIKKAGLSKKVSHVSTGGGASLEFLEGKPLPGVLALTEK
ncbi:MAG: phosphoglycerate kinase [candidate division FCPU426 bacterium]